MADPIGDDLLVHRARVEMESSTQDADGGNVLAWTTRIASIKCYIGEQSTSEQQVEGSTEGWQVSHVMWTNYLGIQRGDRLFVLNQGGNPVEAKNMYLRVVTVDLHGAMISTDIAPYAKVKLVQTVY
ncbi:hypothetical protein [Fimbriiglobus ruber]|uniref:Uncharacterized protein n=1 Tax=Fimbriiglobus ruber TaxID=1908690 RepID=A0A225DDV0_9BACT|nr:hypothetical protein [Fimbriiglobus ruber]OWK34297.1 hypothetical protein FRUB_10268 [Fimbriiglobus ruber]